MTELAARLDRRLFEVHVACLRDGGTLRSRIEGTAASIEAFPLRTFKSADALRQMFRFAGWCHDRGIRAFCLTFDRQLEWTAFGVWLTMLLHAHGARVLRIRPLDS